MTAYHCTWVAVFVEVIGIGVVTNVALDNESGGPFIFDWIDRVTDDAQNVETR